MHMQVQPFYQINVVVSLYLPHQVALRYVEFLKTCGGWFLRQKVYVWEGDCFFSETRELLFLVINGKFPLFRHYDYVNNITQTVNCYTSNPHWLTVGFIKNTFDIIYEKVKKIRVYVASRFYPCSCHPSMFYKVFQICEIISFIFSWKIYAIIALLGKCKSVRFRPIFNVLVS